MKKITRKLDLNRESIRRLTAPDAALIGGGRACGCSWTCTDDPLMCTVTQQAGGCTVTSMTGAITC